MKTMHCNIGSWNVEARIDAAGDRQSIAIVRAVQENQDNENQKRIDPSRHVVVFDHEPGVDLLQETRKVIENVLNGAH